MTNVENAISLFKKGFRCSQAILSVYATQFGLDQELALRLASPFGGGMGSLRNTCGAVTGAFMVLGLKYGHSKVGELKKKEKANQIAKDFVEKFKSRNGSIMCKELLNCDISTPEGRNKAIEEKFFIEICPNLVRDSAEILEELL
ncbi:MAG: C_GCAxxG_C_C family protein [Candidatus Lokiarchaeota archaeon]|nr:C_GCAxxG_C_C family protein [Candidatus Lokiarchaeota archaeon]